MSVNLLPNMLNKLHREKETIRPLVTSNQTASGKADEWIAPLPVHAPPPLSSDFLSTLVTDQCESLAQIAHHVCSLMVSGEPDMECWAPVWEMLRTAMINTRKLLQQMLGNLCIIML